MSVTASIKENFRPLSMLSALLLAAALQGLHFYFYYQQPASNAIIWSIVDWCAWFAVIGTLHYFYRQLSKIDAKKVYWLVFLGVILFSGPLQIMLSNTINGLISLPSRPFWDDFVHLYDKRWLQNLFYAGFLWQFFNFLWPLSPGKGLYAEKRIECLSKPLKVADGKTIYWLKPKEIRYVESARNYLLIHLDGREILVRESLKEITAQLSLLSFIQVSRSCLVNKTHIKQIGRYSKYSKQITLDDGTILKIGKTYRLKVEKALNKE